MFCAYAALVLALLPLASAQDYGPASPAASSTAPAAPISSSTSATTDNDPTAITSGLEQAKIIPDVIPTGSMVRLPYNVVYTANDSTFPVSLGVNLTKAQTVNIPSLGLVTNNNITGKPYLIAIVDPDDPSPAQRSTGEFLHFLAADYIADNSTNGTWVMHATTPALTNYTPPSPPADSAPHRYVVLNYLQARVGLTPPTSFNGSNLSNFSVSDFVTEVNKSNPLTLVAATYFWVSANDTTGSVKPNSTSGRGVAPSSTGSSSGAMKVGAAIVWTVGGIFSATVALLF